MVHTERIFIPYDHCKQQNNMYGNSLLYTQLSFQKVYCWKCKNILKLCQTFLKPLKCKKYKNFTGLCKKVFINVPIVSLDSSNKIKLVLQSFTRHLRQTLVYMWSSEIWESCNFYLQQVFASINKIFYFGRRTEH